MFFSLSKLGWGLIQPGVLLTLLCALSALLLYTRWRRFGRAVITLLAVVMLAIAVTPLDRWALEPLETRFPAQPWDIPAIDGVVVLSGAERMEVYQQTGRAEVNELAERLTAMVRLAREHPDARVIFSGGGVPFEPNTPTGAEAARAFVEEVGADPDRFQWENYALNTWQNANFLRELANPKPGERWLLVTSAFHMPRSVAAFRKAGFDVIPFPVGPELGPPSGDLIDLEIQSLQFHRRLTRLTFALHEYVGLALYWLTDRGSSLFPAPDPALTPAPASAPQPKSNPEPRPEAARVVTSSQIRGIGAASAATFSSAHDAASPPTNAASPRG